MKRMVYNDMSRRHCGNLAHLVAHKRNSSVGAHRFHFLEHTIQLMFEMFVKITQWLVKNHYFRLGYKRTAKKSALELTARQLTDRRTGLYFEFKARKHVGHTSVYIIMRCLGTHKSEPYHFFDSNRKPCIHGTFLRQITDSESRCLIAVAVKVAHTPGGGTQQPEHDAEKSGFTAAVGTGNRHKITAVDIESYIFQHLLATIVHSYVGKTYSRSACHISFALRIHYCKISYFS